jgi:hypothetical protein
MIVSCLETHKDALLGDFLHKGIFAARQYGVVTGLPQAPAPLGPEYSGWTLDIGYWAFKTHYLSPKIDT